MSETNESKMKVVGKSAEAVNRVVDILMGVDAEFQVPMQGLELPARPGVRDFQVQNHWWRDDAELDEETGFWSLEIEGSIYSEQIGFPAICKALDVGIKLYTADRRHWTQKLLAVSHTGEVTTQREDCFGEPEDEDGNPIDLTKTKLDPDDWGWGSYGYFNSDEEIYAGAK